MTIMNKSAYLTEHKRVESWCQKSNETLEIRQNLYDKLQICPIQKQSVPYALLFMLVIT